ncbi:FAD-dependent oxidoreductase [Dehalobacter sp. DCM]|uniref:FAD-dependent oxidoreductase n=1 Tax=Dehalobacter sp. DCM TaxID=2907827 RepID=UPI0030819898|nr:FAD-dependent oxidoreductase [Dehalobacter sp. DCM]
MNKKTADFSQPPQSYWIASTPQPQHSVLNEDIETDIAIIGGGIVGLTTAYLLKQEGFTVSVVEADCILQGTTGNTTAKVTSQHTLVYNRIFQKFGKDKAQHYADANQTAIKTVSDLVNSLKIDCDFSWQSAYCFTHRDDYVPEIMNEVNTASLLGIQAYFVPEIPLPLGIKGAVRFDGQAQIHPRKYLLALAEKIPGNGSYIFEQTRVTRVDEGKPHRVITKNGKTITAKIVIIATHYPCYEAHGMYFSRLYPERSYALGVRIKGKYPGGMYITAEDPARSLRSHMTKDEQLVIVSGEHHKTGQGEDTSNHYRKLKDFAEQLFTVIDIPYRWSTQDYSTADGVPYIGQLTSDTQEIYVATGFGKWGMSTSTAAALIFRDMILNGYSPWQDIYRPSRFTPIASAKSFVKENLNVAKHLISGKLSPVPDKNEIPCGEGKIIEYEGQRTGAYREQNGKLHLIDTTCTHMGCELQWNSAEKSWDCPCHGSRFTYSGEIVDSPALDNIEHKILE